MRDYDNNYNDHNVQLVVVVVGGREGVVCLFFGHFDSHVRTIKTPGADAEQRKVTHLLEQTSHPHPNKKKKNCGYLTHLKPLHP